MLIHGCPCTYKKKPCLHLTSDTSLEELEEFARQIGLRPEWRHDAHRPHYDVFGKMIDRAREAGAQDVPKREWMDRAIRKDAWRTK